MAIIVGVADNPLGAAALDRAIEEAALRQLPLVLVSQVPRPRNEPEAARYRERRAQVEAELEAKVREVSARGVTCSGYVPVTPASPADAVLAAADEHDAALIVVGIRRRSPLGKAVLGSSAQDVLLAADCPVLSVKLPPGVEDAL